MPGKTSITYVYVYFERELVKRVALRPGQSLTVGRSEFADLSLAFDVALRDVHFVLWFDEDRICRVRGEEVFVNDRPVTESVIWNNDQIQAGGTLIVVETSEEATPAEAGPDVVADERLRYTFTPTDSGLNCASGSDRTDDWKHVFRGLGDRYDGYLLIDYQGAGLPIPARIADECEMLLSGIAEAQRFGHSLHLVPLSMFEDPFHEFDRLRKHDCAIAVFATSTADQIGRAIRKMPGWFVKASAFSHLFGHGVPELILPLIEPIDALLTVAAGEDKVHWATFSHPARAASWESLGLPNEPEGLKQKS